MRVTQEAIGIAVLQIFFDLRATRAGTTVLRSDLAAAWVMTGLRTHDLSDGLDSLCSQGLLECSLDPATDDERITVLPAGETRLKGNARNWRERVGALRSAWVLRRAARRGRHNKFLRRVRCSVLGHHPDFDSKGH